MKKTNRTSTFMLRLSKEERDMLDAVCARNQTSRARMVRFLVRREARRLGMPVEDKP